MTPLEAFAPIVASRQFQTCSLVDHSNLGASRDLHAAPGDGVLRVHG